MVVNSSRESAMIASPSFALRPAAILVALSLMAGTAVAQDIKVNLDVPYVPTPQAVVERMLDLADVKKDDYVVDLGSGDGRMPIRAAERVGARGLGVDLNPDRVSEAKENAEKAGVSDKVSFRVGDLYEESLSDDVTVMTMYLLSRVNLDLRPRILNGLKPGTRIVSHAFDMGDWTPDRHEKVEGRDVFFWVVPAKVDGRWTLRDGDSELQLDLTQQFQKVQGVVRGDGRYHSLRGVSLRGDEIRFSFERDGKTREFVGTVDGDTIEAQGDAKWSARRNS
jgi:SAM-dependent methyltransferase